MQQKQLTPAIYYMDEAYEVASSIGIALQQADWVLGAGFPDDAERYIERAKKTKQKLGYKAWFTSSRR